MATLQPILFGFPGTQMPAGSPVTVGRTGVDNAPISPGNPAPVEVGNPDVFGDQRGVNRIRFVCAGVCTVYTEGTHGDHTTVGPGIAVPAGRVVELWLEAGTERELVPGFVIRGCLLSPAIGAAMTVWGGP